MVVNATPGRFTPGKDPVPIVHEAGTGAENLAPSGFDPRTVQPIANRYNVYAIPDPTFIKETKIFSPAGVRTLELPVRSTISAAPSAYTLKINFNKIRMFVTNISAILLTVRERYVRPLRCVTDRQQYNTNTESLQWIPLFEHNGHVPVYQSSSSSRR